MSVNQTQTRRTNADKVLPALALFGAGLMVGVGLGLILAPSSGSELRGELESKFHDAQRKMGLEGVAKNGESAEASQPPVRPV